jgi:molybdate transport system substrate-binding protein
LVIIAPKNEGFEVRIRPEFDLAAALTGRIALGDPEHVPAGMYARQALEHVGWYAAIRPRLVPCQNVRMALAAVELRETAAGVVYATDAHASEKVDILAVFPSESHSPIRYPAALCRGASARASARAARFLDYLSGPEAADAFRRHGFVTPRRDGGPHGE